MKHKRSSEDFVFSNDGKLIIDEEATQMSGTG